MSSEMQSSKLWYVMLDGKDFGPLTDADVEQLAKSGQIGRTSQLRDGDGHWTMADSIIDFTGLRIERSAAEKPDMLFANDCGTSAFSWDEIREVARSQRWLNLCILVVIFASLAIGLFRSIEQTKKAMEEYSRARMAERANLQVSPNGDSAARGNDVKDNLSLPSPTALKLILFAAMLVGIQFASIYWLAKSLRYRRLIWWAIAGSVPYFLPTIGPFAVIFVMGWLSSAANKLLRAQGLKVGFFGVRPSTNPPPGWTFRLSS